MKIIKSKKLISIIIIIFVVVAGLYTYNNFISSKGQAKNFAEDYMEAVKKGEGTSDYVGIDTEGFIDVFDYEHLSTEELPEKKDITTFNIDDYDLAKEYSDDYEHGSYDDYKKHYKEVFIREGSNYEVTEESATTLEIWETGEYLKRYNFLYNVTIANGLGQKIYKKADITVEQDIDGWEIVDIYVD